jgi:hypothetical protein
VKTFRQVPSTAPFVKSGKNALTSLHSHLVIEHRTRRINASLSFEAIALKYKYHEKRWDYFIEISSTPEKCHAFEVHKYKESDLIEKKRGTLHILAKLCPSASTEIVSWHVAVTGDLPRRDLIARFTANTGIHIARILDLSKL